MEFENIKNMRARDLDRELVAKIINRAYSKSTKIMEKALSPELHDDEFTFEMTQKILLSAMFENLMNVAETIGDLSDFITVGAFEHLSETMGLSKEEILEMEEADMKELIKPYLDLQHRYADFNNNELEDMLFETAKNLLSPIELMTMYLGF